MSEMYGTDVSCKSKEEKQRGRKRGRDPLKVLMVFFHE
jgi:hypothetical protein